MSALGVNVFPPVRDVNWTLPARRPLSAYSIDEENARAKGEGVFGWFHWHREACGGSWRGNSNLNNFGLTLTQSEYQPRVSGDEDRTWPAGHAFCWCGAVMYYWSDPGTGILVMRETVRGSFVR